MNYYLLTWYIGPDEDNIVRALDLATEKSLGEVYSKYDNNPKANLRIADCVKTDSDEWVTEDGELL